MVTGDPFVDAGGVVLEYLKNQFPEKNIIDLIDFAAEIFIYKWNGKIDSLQLNSNITHNSKRGSLEKQKKAKENVKKYFENILNSGSFSDASGYCRICGKKGKNFKVGRETFPLSGSGKFVNFHHGHENGILLCNDCITKLFFLPLAVLQMRKNLALLHVHSEKIKEYWIEKVIKKNLDNYSKNISEGILKSKLNNPKNALFEMASELINEFEAKNEYLQLFYFTNFGANPNCEIYILPNPVFRFISKVLRYCRKDWFVFIKRYYKVSKATWDYTTFEWVSEKEGKITKDYYQDEKNMVIEYLLEGKSLIGILKKFYRENFLKKKEVSSLILDYYLKEVKNMDLKQIELIKRLGKSIIEISRKENNFKKYLTMIEGANKAFQLRAIIITLIKKHYINGEEKPLITLDEYVNYLFPDGQYWSEIRDILLIYLYELLHEENIKNIDVEESNLEEPEDELIEF
ncbi:CRISPR-associated protein (Cas_CXXC_CXXC) [Marinitoga piezophila KA3]|uniref:CRISPR-associated protein (Cas_CXXC_CXXC) n=1 Tax=Marinitoga piezophila (strain DSM 14283 / JCM 11233 / KA3) TaxID=443254 RepID=H2J3Z7_MARPK|nr:Cas8a1 family CRISPR/Cas system-associated protein [Marinitoga piezophila]AEX84725.1 CRISPR-associated protein (Cas_CXXC_CXXC) [Marinitoga piezophila KA3]